jgi:hypothetical protein
MPRKTTGTTTGTTATTRKKKAATVAAPVITSAAEEVRKTVHDVRLEDEIRQRAYEIYLERNGSSGDQHLDWLTAEREVLARH